MSRESYRIKQQERGSKRLLHTRPLFQSMPFKSGEKSSGKQEPADNKKSGSFCEMPAKRIMKLPRLWSWQPISTCHRTLWPLASIRLAFTTGFQSLVLMTPSIMSKTTNIKSCAIKLSHRIKISRTSRSSCFLISLSQLMCPTTCQSRNWSKCILINW